MITLFLPGAYHLIGWSCLHVDVLSQNVVFLIGKFVQEPGKGERECCTCEIVVWLINMSLFDVLVAVAVVFAEIQEGAWAGIEAAPLPPPPFPQKSTTSLALSVIRLSQSSSLLISVSLSRSLLPQKIWKIYRSRFALVKAIELDLKASLQCDQLLDQEKKKRSAGSAHFLSIRQFHWGRAHRAEFFNFRPVLEFHQ